MAQMQTEDCPKDYNGDTRYCPYAVSDDESPMCSVTGVICGEPAPGEATAYPSWVDDGQPTVGLEEIADQTAFVVVGVK